MPVISERPRVAEFLQSTSINYLSMDKQYFDSTAHWSGDAIPAGQVYSVVGGNAVAWDGDASDGSEVASGILYEGVDAGDACYRTVVVRKAEIKGNALTADGTTDELNNSLGQIGITLADAAVVVVSNPGTGGGGGADLSGYHLIMYMGNSAAVGRGTNTGYTFDTSVLEYNQSDILAAAGTSFGNGGNIDAGDSNNAATYYSPAVAFCSEYLSLNPTLEGLILVATCQGGSGMSSGDGWEVPAGTQTAEALTRLQAARTAASAAGYSITKEIFTYMTLSTDTSSAANANTFTGKIGLFNDFIDYWEGQAATSEYAICINTGPAQEWMDSTSDTLNYEMHAQPRRTFDYRRSNVGVVDFQSFPQTLIDSNGHASTETNHTLIGPALAAAAHNAGSRETTEFETLSFFSEMDGSYPQNVPLFDEVTETTRAVINTDNAPSALEVTASGKTFTGSVSSSTRVAAVPFTHTTAWSIMWSGVVDSFGAAFGLFQNTGDQIRMYYSNSSSEWAFGTTGAAGTVTPTAAAGDLISMVMTFNAGTLALYENGVLVGTATDVVPTLNTQELAIGAQNRGGTGPLSGTTQHVGVIGRALTAIEAAEYHTVATS